MAEDLNQTAEEETMETAEESAPEGNAPEDVAPDEGNAELKAHIVELEAALASTQQHVAELEESLRLREARIIELDGSLDEVENALKERESELEAARAQLAQAVALYRTSLLATETEIPEELVQGTTVEEVETSLAQARQMVEQVRSRLESQASQERMPFGAPVRSAPDMSSLSPQEKILLGLSRR